MSAYTDSDVDVVCWRLQGFEVRLFARNLDKAERMFGPDGATVDIVVGDVKDKEALAEAAAGCQAAIYVAGSNSILGGNTYKEVKRSINFHFMLVRFELSTAAYIRVHISPARVTRLYVVVSVVSCFYITV
jgi:nucleoside-diphosphate-sugar epimerase